MLSTSRLLAPDCVGVESEEYVVKTFLRVFGGRKDCRGTIQGGCVKGNLKVSHVEHHLNGIESLGRYPLLDEGTCYWAVVDFDFKSKHDRKSLAEKHSKRFITELNKFGITAPWLERSTSPKSVEAGFYFANPRNRFWKALNRSRLVDVNLEPGEASMQILFTKYKIGFTDLVKRPTRMGNELRAADYKEWVPVLKGKLMEYQPVIVWFHGQGTYKYYLKYAEGLDKKVNPGVQKQSIGKIRVFVTPNPSPANARFSLDDIVRSYNEMVSYRIREAFGVG